MSFDWQDFIRLDISDPEHAQNMALVLDQLSRLPAFQQTLEKLGERPARSEGFLRDVITDYRNVLSGNYNPQTALIQPPPTSSGPDAGYVAAILHDVQSMLPNHYTLNETLAALDADAIQQRFGDNPPDMKSREWIDLIIREGGPLEQFINNGTYRAFLDTHYALPVSLIELGSVLGATRQGLSDSYYNSATDSIMVGKPEPVEERMVVMQTEAGTLTPISVQRAALEEIVHAAEHFRGRSSHISYSAFASELEAMHRDAPEAFAPGGALHNKHGYALYSNVRPLVTLGAITIPEDQQSAVEAGDFSGLEGINRLAVALSRARIERIEEPDNEIIDAIAENLGIPRRGDYDGSTRLSGLDPATIPTEYADLERFGDISNGLRDLFIDAIPDSYTQMGNRAAETYISGQHLTNLALRVASGELAISQLTEAARNGDKTPTGGTITDLTQHELDTLSAALQSANSDGTITHEEALEAVAITINAQPRTNTGRN